MSIWACFYDFRFEFHIVLKWYFIKWGSLLYSSNTYLLLGIFEFNFCVYFSLYLYYYLRIATYSKWIKSGCRFARYFVSPLKSVFVRCMCRLCRRVLNTKLSILFAWFWLGVVGAAFGMLVFRKVSFQLVIDCVRVGCSLPHRKTTHNKYSYESLQMNEIITCGWALTMWHFGFFQIPCYITYNFK